ncbi:MAG: AI-2E family transporter [Hydrogenothermaceae bacterium]
MFSDYQKLGNVFFVISFLFFLFLSYKIFEPFLTLISSSIILVLIFYPVHRFLLKKIKKPVFTSLLSTLMIMAVIIMPIAIIVSFLTKEIIEFYPTVSGYISDPSKIVEKLKEYPFLYNIYLKLYDKFYNNLDSQAYESIVKYIKGFSGFIFDKAKVFATNTLIFIVAIFIMAITIFFLFKDGEKLYRYVYSIIPLDEREKDFLFSTSYLAIQGVILGSVFVALAQSFLAFLGFVVIGVDYALLLAFLTFLAAFIPFGGASLVWVPVAIYILTSKSLVAGIIFFIYGTFVISLIDNIIRPIVVGSKVDIHPMILFFAIIGGINFFGFLGIFFAPVVIALLNTFIQLYKDRYNIS